MSRCRATVSIYCDIYDEVALLAAATSIATRDLSADEAFKTLHFGEEVDIGACLQMILDPGYISGAGFEIEESSCELLEDIEP